MPTQASGCQSRRYDAARLRQDTFSAECREKHGSVGTGMFVQTVCRGSHSSLPTTAPAPPVLFLWLIPSLAV
eukprot:1925190-Prorocentrum_lima.AAC.1